MPSLTVELTATLSSGRKVTREMLIEYTKESNYGGGYGRSGVSAVFYDTLEPVVPFSIEPMAAHDDLPLSQQEKEEAEKELLFLAETHDLD